MNKINKYSKTPSRTTYFLSSRFLPKAVRDDMFKLYSFERIVKGFTEAESLDVKKFDHFEQRWQTVKGELVEKRVATPLDNSASERVIANIAYLTHRHGFDAAWVDAFLKSMRWDLQKHQYRTLKDLGEYMYGSSEVIALMIVRILGLPEESMKAARLQGRAIQYIMFLRDIANNNENGCTYFPANEIKKYGLKNLTEAETRKKPGMFTDFMHAELLRYAQWQSEANDALAHIPKRVRIPLLSTIDSFNWVARELKYNPFSVYDHKLKPHKRQVIRQLVRHSIKR